MLQRIQSLYILGFISITLLYSLRFPIPFEVKPILFNGFLATHLISLQFLLLWACFYFLNARFRFDWIHSSCWFYWVWGIFNYSSLRAIWNFERINPHSLCSCLFELDIHSISQ